MKLLIGVASYLSHERLRVALQSIRDATTGDWECLIIQNLSGDKLGDDEAGVVAAGLEAEDSRFKWMPQANSGYCGAVNRLWEIAVERGVEVVAYCDHDVEIKTRGWNEQMQSLLMTNQDCGWVFPGDGHFPLDNGRYRECLWHAGYCFMLSMKARAQWQAREAYMYQPTYLRAGFMDDQLGHHEEVSAMIRLRLAGFTTACIPAIEVIHHETATRADSKDHQPGGRIHDGVVRFMNKHNRMFCGDSLSYSMTAYDPRALRYSDWHPDALYLERMTLANFPQMNANPREVYVPGVGNMDAIEVLKPTGCYRGRAI